MLHAISIRNRKGTGESAVFGSELGEPSYLSAPMDASAFLPTHGGRSKNQAVAWAKRVVGEAREKAPEVDGVKTGDIIVFIHGYNVSAKDAVRGHKQLIRNVATDDLGLGHAVVVSYDWPAKGSFLNYLEDAVDAQRAALYLVESGLKMLAMFSEPDCQIRVHLLAHSMGALVAREGLRSATAYRPTRDRAWSISQTVLVAADISSASLAGRDGWAVHHFSNRVTNYFNRCDKALATSNVKRVLTSPRLGRHGAPREIRGRIADVDTTQRWNRVAKTNETGPLGDVPASHSFYFEDEVWLRDFAATILGNVDRRALDTRDDHPDEPGRLILKPEG